MSQLRPARPWPPSFVIPCVSWRDLTTLAAEFTFKMFADLPKGCR